MSRPGPSEAPLTGIPGKVPVGRVGNLRADWRYPCRDTLPGGVDAAACFVVASYHTSILPLWCGNEIRSALRRGLGEPPPKSPGAVAGEDLRGREQRRWYVVTVNPDRRNVAGRDRFRSPGSGLQAEQGTVISILRSLPGQAAAPIAGLRRRRHRDDAVRKSGPQRDAPEAVL